MTNPTRSIRGGAAGVISPTPEGRRVVLPGARDVDHAAIAALTAEALERRAGWIRRALASAQPR